MIKSLLAGAALALLSSVSAPLAFGARPSLCTSRATSRAQMATRFTFFGAVKTAA